MYGQNLEGNRHQTAESDISVSSVGKLRKAWAAPMSSQSAPVIAGTCVYTLKDASANPPVVAALDIDTGEVVWEAELPPGNVGGVTALTAGSQQAVAVVDGRVHISQWVLANDEIGQPAGGIGLALDADTGERLWTSEVIEFGHGGWAIGSAMVFSGMHVVVLTGPDGDPQARPGYGLLDAETGETIYKQAVIPLEDHEAGFAGGGQWGTPVFDTVNNWMFNGTANPKSAKREHKYDNAILKIDVGRDRSTFGTILDHYKGSPDGFFGAYENNPACSEGGSLITPQCGHLDSGFVSPTAFRNSKGELLVGGLQRDGRFHVANAATMAKEWAQTLSHPDSVGGSAAAAADSENVYVATNRGPVFALDNDTGQIQWVSWVPSGFSYAPLALANGVLFVPGNQSATLTALNAADGTPLWASQLHADSVGNGNVPCNHVGAGVSIGRGYVIAGCDNRSTVAYKIDPDAPPLPSGGLPGGEPPAGDPPGSGLPGLPAPEVPELPGVPAPELPDGSPARGPIVAPPAGNQVGYAIQQAATPAGSLATFVNLDPVGVHDVVANDRGADGKPLFRSEQAGNGQIADVTGTDKLAAGSYGFFCSVHPNMRGTLQVVG